MSFFYGDLAMVQQILQTQGANVPQVALDIVTASPRYRDDITTTAISKRHWNDTVLIKFSINFYDVVAIPNYYFFLFQY